MKTFTKSTDTFQYLERKSSHPQNVFTGFLKAEFLRHIRNTNNKKELIKLIQAFKNVIKQTINTNRADLLKENISNGNNIQSSLVLIILYT